MNLNQKIFITFFALVTALLCTTLYLIDTQAEQHEIKRIIAELNKTQAKFQRDLETRQKHIQSLSYIITSDQKFRSFLSQIKDNFYPFTAELGKDTGADFVVMLDDSPKIRAVFAKNSLLPLPFDNQLTAFNIEQYFDAASNHSKMISLGSNIYSSHFIPLKENRTDDFAVGLIAIINQINDDWVTKLLLGINVDFQAVFFNRYKVVADNTDIGFSSTVLKNREKIAQTGFFEFNKQRYIAKQVSFDVTNPHMGYILSANLDASLVAFKQLQQHILVIGISILCMGSLLFLWLSRRITQPLRLITKGTLAIKKGDYHYRINYKSKDEVGQLADAFNVMVGGLEEKEQIYKLFNTYVDPAIVSELMSHPDKLKLGGVRQEQSILFSDIAGFTSFSERMPAEALVTVLNNYFTAMTKEISAQQGIVDKFIGDGIKAFWSPDLCPNQYAQRACQTALNMQMSLKELRPEWKKQGAPEIHVRIGIATGEVIVGNIGSETSRSYTSIGDKVNYSSRLEGVNKHYKTQIIIDQQTAKKIHGFVLRELDTVRVIGRKEAESIFELVGEVSIVDDRILEKIDIYQQGLSCYRQGFFVEAADIFAKLSNDAPSHVMYGRCLEFQKLSPPENWGGVYSLLDK